MALRILCALAVVLGLIGCVSTSPPAPAPSPAPEASDTPAPSPVLATRAPSFTPLPTLAPVLSSTPTRTPSATPTRSSPESHETRTSPPALIEIARSNNPDDLALAADGSIYFSDISDGALKRWARDGQVTTILRGLIEPEGIAFLPDSSLVIAEQGKNRLMRYDPGTKRLTVFATFENKTNQAGIDNLLYSARDRALLVPDSPNGRLLWLDESGKVISSSPALWKRPTGVAVQADGALLITDEFGGALVRYAANAVPPSVIIARLSLPDDVIVDAQGTIFVNTLGDGAIHRIDPATGADRVLVRGLVDPQGIIFDADGNLVIADAGHHRLVKVVVR